MAEDRLSDPIEARKKAMDYLARREHGRVELQKKLRKAGFGEDVAEEAITGLIDDGLQNEQRFVEAFVQSRIGQRKGPARIRAELQERGVNGGLIEDGLREADQDWCGLAREVRKRKFGLNQPADFKEKARQMRFLQYRGFEPDHIQAAVSAGDE